jgi:hypothetical protein
MRHQAADLAHLLARDAEAVCRHYLSMAGKKAATGWSATFTTHPDAASMSVCKDQALARVQPGAGAMPQRVKAAICWT